VQLSAIVDDDAPLARVQFFVDGLPIGVPLITAPWVTTWNTSGTNAALPHMISARATDLLGRTGASALLSVQVDNGPAISNVTVAAGLTSTSQRVTWSTDMPGDGQVEYGLTTAYGTATPVDALPALRHDMQLTSLAPGAIYHYRVKSRDANGGLATSPDGTFYTLP
jgi:hypothetical protein